MTTPHTMLRICALAVLGIVAALSVVSYALMGSAMDAQSEDASIINLSGRQRMLSQKMAKSAVRIELGARRADPAMVRSSLEELNASFTLWNASHARVRQDPRAMDHTTDIAQELANLEPIADGLRAAAASVVVSGNRVADALEANELQTQTVEELSSAVGVVLDRERAFLPVMDTLVTAFEHDAIRGIEHAQALQRWLAAIMICTVGLSLIVAFEPAARLLKKQFEEASAFRVNAEEMVKARSAFLAQMSHELRTPLTAMMGYAESLTNPNANTTARNAARAGLTRNGEHLLDLVNRVLDLSKLDAGKAQPEPADTDLAECIRGVVSMLHGLATEKKLGFSARALTALPRTVHTDAGMLRQALVNLVSNAIKYTPTGSVRIDLSSGLSDDRTRRIVVVSVVDTGPGMSEEQVARLFGEFVQVGATAKDRKNGTGLGLAITARIAKVLGGQITVSSTPGRGSTFTLEFDAGAAETSTMLQPHEFTLDAPVTERPEPAAPNLANFRVLVVDGSEDARNLVTSAVGTEGGTVESLADGHRALERIRAGDLTLVFTEQDLPGIVGAQIANTIRQLGVDTPFVCFSTTPPTPGTEHLFAATVAKPASSRMIVDACIEAVRVHGSRVHARKTTAPLGNPSAGSPGSRAA